MVQKIKTRIFSVQTRNNFILDLNMFVSGLTAVLSGVYFLFLPAGYQGGRNPLYGIIIVFERRVWEDIHTWSSVLIMALALLHIPLHWNWILKMTKAGFRQLSAKTTLNKYGMFNLFINVLIGMSGFVCGLSGLYFLLLPQKPTWIFTPLAWDMIHTWSGVVMTAAAVLHFAIHWKWAAKVFRKYWGVLWNRGQTGSAEILEAAASGTER